MDVRVDGGPQDGTILVTWIPVTLNVAGGRHVVPVTGYAVFADGKRVTDVDSPSSDHALVDLGCIGHFNPKLITVRSKSGDLLSNDSSAVPIQGTKTQRRTRVRISRLGDNYKQKCCYDADSMTTIASLLQSLIVNAPLRVIESVILSQIMCAKYKWRHVYYHFFKDIEYDLLHNGSE